MNVWLESDWDWSLARLRPDRKYDRVSGDVRAFSSRVLLWLESYARPVPEHRVRRDTEDTDLAVVLKNSSGRKVLIQISSDPDLSITEVLLSANRPLVAIEVNGGRDLSNIHNRVGEAEKSHQKAR